MLQFRHMSGYTQMVVAQAECGGFQAGEILAVEYGTGGGRYTVTYKLLGRRIKSEKGFDNVEQALKAGKAKMQEFHSEALKKAGLREDV